MAPGLELEHSQVRKRRFAKDTPAVSDQDFEAEPGSGSEGLRFTRNDERRVAMDYLKVDHRTLHKLDPYSAPEKYRLKMRQWPSLRSSKKTPKNWTERSEFTLNNPLTVVLEQPRSLTRSKAYPLQLLGSAPKLL